MTALITGNLLSVNQQSSDTSAGWSANGTNTTIAWDQVVYRSAPGSVKMTATAIGTVQQRTGYGITATVPENTALEVYTHVKASGSWGVSVLVNWISAADANISQSNVAATGTTTAGVWNKWTSPVMTSPPGTVDAQVIITITGLEAGEVVNTDDTYFGTAAVVNQPPTANAGNAQSVAAGATVTLTGTGTDPDGTIASYTWTLPTRPVGSAAALAGTGATRTFTADKAGTYTASLVVTDNAGATSEPSLVTVTAAGAAATGTLRLGGFDVKPMVGTTAVTKMYLGTTQVYTAAGATSQYIVENTQTGTGAYQWEYSSGWSVGTLDHYTNVVGSTATHDFTSTRVRLFGAKTPDSGLMTVSLDGVLTSVDLYAATRADNVLLYDSGTITNAAHVLILTCAGDRNGASSGFYVNIDRAVHDIVGAPPVVTPEEPPAPPPVGTRDVTLHPYRGSWTPGAPDGTWSIWNTPVGSGAKLVSAGFQPANASDGGDIVRDPMHFGYSGPKTPGGPVTTDPIKTLSGAKKADGTYYETRSPWGQGGTAQVRVSPADNAPGAYEGGNHPAAFPLSTDNTRLWTGHPLGLVAGGNPTMRYMDPVSAPDDLYGQGHYGAHGGSHMSAIGGCIRQWEWDSADVDVIKHCIEFNIWALKYFSFTTGGKRWPANSVDQYASSSTYGGTNPAVKNGSLLVLPADYVIPSGADLNARKVISAMKRFGGYIVDDSYRDVYQITLEATITISALTKTGFHTPIMDAMTSLMVVDNNSPTSVGGGGTPRTALVDDVVRP